MAYDRAPQEQPGESAAGQEEQENDASREEEAVEKEALQVVARRNGRMLTGLVIGVFSLFLWWLPVIGCLLAATGLVIAIRRFHEIPSRKTAFAGLILNSVGLVLGLVFTAGIIFSIVHMA